MRCALNQILVGDFDLFIFEEKNIVQRSFVITWDTFRKF